MKYLVIIFLSLIILSNAFPNPQDNEEVSLDDLLGMYKKYVYTCRINDKRHIRNGTIALHLKYL